MAQQRTCPDRQQAVGATGCCNTNDPCSVTALQCWAPPASMSSRALASSSRACREGADATGLTTRGSAAAAAAAFALAAVAAATATAAAAAAAAFTTLGLAGAATSAGVAHCWLTRTGPGFGKAPAAARSALSYSPSSKSGGRGAGNGWKEVKSQRTSPRAAGVNLPALESGLCFDRTLRSMPIDEIGDDTRSCFVHRDRLRGERR